MSYKKKRKSSAYHEYLRRQYGLAKGQGYTVSDEDRAAFNSHVAAHAKGQEIIAIVAICAILTFLVGAYMVSVFATVASLVSGA